jgi:hypothetical protein
MTYSISSVSSEQLRQAIHIKEKIEALEGELEALLSGNQVSQTLNTAAKRGGMSAAGRARIAAAQKARWAKFRGTEVAAADTKPKRKMSAAAKAKIAAAARARWKKAKAEGKNSL